MQLYPLDMLFAVSESANLITEKKRRQAPAAGVREAAEDEALMSSTWMSDELNDIVVAQRLFVRVVVVKYVRHPSSTHLQSATHLLHYM